MTETKKTLVEEMLERHRKRMAEIFDLEINTVSTLAAAHIESIHNNAQLNMHNRQKASKLAEGLLNAITERDSKRTV